MRKTLSTIVLTGALLVTSAPAFSVGATDPTPLPQCATITTLDCQGTFVNLRLGDEFVQVVNGGTAQHEAFWPFRNPTVNAAAAVGDPDAFPFDYASLKTRVATLSAQNANLRDEVAAQADTIISQRALIEHQRKVIRRLRARLARS